MRDNIRFMSGVLFDHAMNDWRGVILHKVSRPAAIFSGEGSRNLSAQRWIRAVLPSTQLLVYSKAGFGDHELTSKNPMSCAADLTTFLER